MDLGEGFLWGGTAITFLLGQHRRLQLTDLALQVQEDLEILQVMGSTPPASPESITAQASFYKASVNLDSKVTAYKQLLQEDDLQGSMKAFCDRARLVTMHTAAALGVLSACDPACAAAPIRPSHDTMCQTLEFDPPEVDNDYC